MTEMTDQPDATPAEGGRMTALEKIGRTLRAISEPEPDAGEMGLTLATVAMALESRMGEEFEIRQQSGELDTFVVALTRWLATHRSDSARQLVVVELPRSELEAVRSIAERPGLAAQAHTQSPRLPAGTRLHLLDEAVRAAHDASVPW